MATRFIDKEFGANSTTAIADDATGRSKVRDLPGAAGIVIDSVDGFLKYNDGGTIRELVNKDEAQTLTNKTLTSPVINGSVEVVTTTNVIDASESGKTFILNSATAFVSTLPAPAAGLQFTFIMGSTSPSGGNHTIVTASSSNIIAGLLFYGPTDDAGTVDADADTLTFVAASVPGDRVSVISDGTLWYAMGFASVAESLTITKAS